MFSRSYIAPELTSKTGVSNGKKDNAQQLNGSFFKGALTEAFFLPPPSSFHSVAVT